MRLCDHIGCAHPDYLPLDDEQIQDWIEYEVSYGTLGSSRNDIFHAHQLAYFVNAHIDPKKTTPVKAKDYMFYTEQGNEKELTLEETEAVLNTIFGRPI